MNYHHRFAQSGLVRYGLVRCERVENGEGRLMSWYPWGLEVPTVVVVLEREELEDALVEAGFQES